MSKAVNATFCKVRATLLHDLLVSGESDVCCASQRPPVNFERSHRIYVPLAFKLQAICAEHAALIVVDPALPVIFFLPA